MPTCQGVRVENGVDFALYGLHETREEEFYDLKTDPHEVSRFNERMRALAQRN